MIGTLKEIKEALGATIVAGDEDINIKGVSTDSRTLREGDLFIALTGESFDGNQFVIPAVKKGAVAAVVTEDGDYGIPYVKVEDGLVAYQRIARFYREKKGFKVVAITGSSGKTTTKDMVYSVLKEKYRVEKTHKNNNNEVGVPYTLLSASDDVEVLVVEMGMRALGEIALLTDIAVPDIGAITNVGIAHVGELGSQENILKAKGELFDHMPAQGIALINGEDGFEEAVKAKVKGEAKVFGFEMKDDIYGKDISLSDSGSCYTVVRGDEEGNVKLPFSGEHFILDSLIALEVGALLGISLKDGIKGLEKLEISDGRMDKVVLKDRVILLNDVYNANPESMKASLNVLSLYKGKKIAVLGDMRELGNEEEKLHHEVGAYVNGLGIDVLITVGAAAQGIGRGAVDAGMPEKTVYSFKSNKEAYEALIKEIEPESGILIKGSRVIGMEEIVELLVGQMEAR